RGGLDDLDADVGEPGGAQVARQVRTDVGVTAVGHDGGGVDPQRLVERDRRRRAERAAHVDVLHGEQATRGDEAAQPADPPCRVGQVGEHEADVDDVEGGTAAHGVGDVLDAQLDRSGQFGAGQLDLHRIAVDADDHAARHPLGEQAGD